MPARVAESFAVKQSTILNNETVEIRIDDPSQKLTSYNFRQHLGTW